MLQKYRVPFIAFVVAWLSILACTLTQQPGATIFAVSPVYLKTKASPTPSLVPTGHTSLPKTFHDAPADKPPACTIGSQIRFYEEGPYVKYSRCKSTRYKSSGQSISRILDIPGDNAYANVIPSCNYKGKQGGTTNA